MTELMLKCLRQAARQVDGTVLVIGFNRHSPDGHMKSYPPATAYSLVKRGMLVPLKAAAWGNVYKITIEGRNYIKSYDCHAP